MNTAQPKLQELLNELVASGRERGIQVAAYHRGQLVLNACAGQADYRTGARVDSETLFAGFSVTKGFVATAIHQLAEAGKLSYDTPIATYWPEFAANGKETVTVRHALAHTSGIPYVPAELQPDTYDWDTICQAIAQLKPSTAPGSAFAYHALTYGWILGETARRVDGRPIQQIVADDICLPLGIQDFYIGLPDALLSRVAFVEDPVGEKAPPPGDTTPQVVPIWTRPLGEWMNQPAARRACVPGGNGIMTAHAVARHYAALLPGGVDGVELLPPARIREASRLNVPTAHNPANPPDPIGLGYHLGGADQMLGSRKTTFGHAGYGGGVGFADPEQHFALGLTKNFFTPEGATVQIAQAVRTLLEIPQ